MQSMLGKSGSLILQVLQHALLVLVLLVILSHNVVRNLFVYIAIMVIVKGFKLEFISSKLKLQLWNDNER
jgi:hypothetical protein